MKSTGALLAVAALTLTGCAGGATGSEGLSCDSIAEQAVAASADQGGAITLLKVRDPKVTNDQRDSYTIPTGTDEALVLACEGVGVWSDGTDTRISLKETVDSDEEFFVAYQAI